MTSRMEECTGPEASSPAAETTATVEQQDWNPRAALARLGLDQHLALEAVLAQKQAQRDAGM